MINILAGWPQLLIEHYLTYLWVPGLGPTHRATKEIRMKSKNIFDFISLLDARKITEQPFQLDDIEKWRKSHKSDEKQAEKH